MRSKSLWAAGVAVVALVVAGCGSSKKSSSSTASTPAAPATTATTPKQVKKATGIPSRTYKLKLKGSVEVPKGAPNGVGDAVVSLHGSTLHVCWRFSHLHGFTDATFAHIHQGKAGVAGNIVVPLSTGPKLVHKGCVPASATLIGAIEKNPSGFYVNIHSKQYPGGAVRSQL
jgi:hypothetical protein